MKNYNYNIKELDLLRSIRNMKLLNIRVTNPSFENAVLSFEKFDLVVSNSLHETNFLENNDEISYFTISKDESKRKVFRLDDAPIEVINVNSKVVSVDIVTDLILIDNKYSVSFASAIIITTSKNKFLICRDWFYMETLNVYIDKSYDDIISIDKVANYFKDDNNIVNVCRNCKKITG